MELKISSPYIIKKNEDGKVRMYADMTIGNKTISPYFEVDEIYENILCDDRNDAFVVLALECAMRNNFQIVSEAPITDTLYYNLNCYLTETLSKITENRHPINIHSDIIPPLIEGEGVATGFSGGVDSWFTVLKNLKTAPERYKLTHLLFHNSGQGIYQDEECIRLRKVTEDLGLHFIYIRSNYFKIMYPLVQDPCNTIEYLSYPFALQKLFHAFIFSSDINITTFTWTSTPLMLSLSTEGLLFFYGGMEAHRRIDKTNYIIHNDINSLAINNFRICNTGQYGGFAKARSCSRCSKCIRTMFSLYALGDTEFLKKNFDYEIFINNIQIFWNIYTSSPLERKLFISEIKDTAQKNGIKLPREREREREFYWQKEPFVTLCKQGRLEPGERMSLSQIVGELGKQELEECFSLEKIVAPGWYWFEQAKRFRKKNDIKTALEFVSKALQHEPFAEQTRELMIDLLLSCGKTDDAAECIRQGLLIDECWATGYQLQAHIYENENNLSAALATLDSGLEKLPHFVDFYLAKSKILLLKEDIFGAIDILVYGMQILPEEDQIYSSLAKLYYDQRMFTNSKKIIELLCQKLKVGGKFKFIIINMPQFLNPLLKIHNIYSESNNNIIKTLHKILKILLKKIKIKLKVYSL